MWVTASAPGKITLFGEHSVVYGKPAVVMAIDRRIHVTLYKRSDNRLIVTLPDLSVKGLRLTFFDDGGPSVEALTPNSVGSYVIEALKIASNRFGALGGLDVKIESTMPVGAGLGTSAALSVATVAAYAALLGVQPTKDEFAEIGKEVETVVQGSSSGMDAAATTYGGVLLFTPKRKVERFSPKTRLLLAVGYTERVMSTAESVRRVSRLVTKYDSVFTGILDSIGNLVLAAKEALESGDLDRVGELMDINHGLLYALGVSTARIEQMVQAARSAGALGAKLTGGGMGGSVVCVCGSPSALERVVAGIRAAGYEAFGVSEDSEGVKIENSAK